MTSLRTPYDIQVIFVPHWITESLKRRGVNFGVFEKPVELHRLLSKEDLASILITSNLMAGDNGYLNGATGILTGSRWDADSVATNRGPVGQNQTRKAEDYWYKWWDTAGWVAKDWDSSIMYMTGSDEFVNSVKARLFESPALKREEDKVPAIIYDTSPTRAVVSVNPGFFVDESQSAKARNEVRLELLRTLYNSLRVKFPRHIVAGTPWCLLYLEALTTGR